MRVAYPAARRSAASYLLHGKTIPEPYDYLEDPANEETKAFVEAQNTCFRSYMKSSDDLRSKIFEKVSATINYARTSAPSLRKGQYFFSHNTGLQNQSVIKRTADLSTMDSAEVFLDPNTLSADGTSALSSTGWSQDESLFAYCVNEKGSDWQHIRVKRLNGEDLPDQVQWVKFSGVSWWKNEGFFYTRYPALSEGADKGAETDSAKDAFICFHKLGTEQSQDITVLAVPEEPLWSLGATVTDCHAYLVINVNKGCDPKNQVWVAKLPASSAELGTMKIQRVVNDFVGEYGFIGNDGPLLYLTSTKGAPRRKVVSIHLDTGVEAELIPQGASVLNDATLVKNTLFLTYLEDVKDVLYFCPLSGGALTRVDLPIGTIVSMFARRECSFMSLKVSSFLLPGRIFTMDVSDPCGSLRVLMDDKVEGLNADDYLTEQRFFKAEDGTRIPMFIVRKKGIVNEKSPLLLNAYGGFNISLTPTFNSLRLTFLMHLGGVFALPNIRGGGEYGEEWHNAGRLTQKQNCFSDFIAAAKYLHSEKIGSPETTAIMGGSNGGLLVAATVNRAPECYSCAVCMVGVLDMYKFHRFTIGHAWTSDYGNPDVAEDFAVVEKYSPLHNIRSNTKYPAMLVMTGDHDDRVVPLHSLKYIATMQHVNPSVGGPLLARVEVSAGHGAGKPTSKIIEETADVYTFIAKHTGAVWKD